MQNTKKLTHSLLFSIVVCVVASTFYIYDFLVRVMPSVMTTNLMATFQINAAGLGILASLYFYGYAPMQVPSGILYDKFGARKIIITTIFLASASTALFAFTTNFYIASFARFMMGATTAFAYTGSLYVGSTHFHKKYFSMYAGLVQVLGSAGAIIGGSPVAALTSRFGWQKTVYLISLLGLILTILMAVFVKSEKPSNEYLSAQKLNFRLVFKNPQNWALALYGFAIWAPITIFPTLWGIPFFEQVYSISATRAAMLIAIIWAGTAVGGPIVGWLSNYIAKRKLPMLSCGLVGLISAIYILYLHPHDNILLIFALFLLGAASSAQALSFGVASDHNPVKILGTAIGFTNMAVVAAGLTLQPAVGFIMDHYWTGQMINGVRIYSAHAYMMALTILPGAYLLAIFTALFLLRETHCKQQY